MAKELPYFKFHVSEWINGDITLESLDEQGSFINICAYYWFKDGQLTLAEAKRRLTQIKPNAFDSLIKKGFLKAEKGFLKISFLDEQLEARGQKSTTNSMNGKKGGRPKRKRTITERFILDNPNESDLKANHKPIREEKRREEEIREKDLSQKVSVFLKREKNPNTMDVTCMVQQWLTAGHTDILPQLKAMKAHYDLNDLTFPTRIETLTESFMSTDWIATVKEADPERRAERIQNAKPKNEPQRDTIGTSPAGSLS